MRSRNEGKEKEERTGEERETEVKREMFMIEDKSIYTAKQILYNIKG